MPQPEVRKGRRGRARLPLGDGMKPGARAAWSGSLSFGLVTIPVELYSAQRDGGVPLRMLTPGGTPLARQYVCPKHEKPLEPDEIVRGYEVSKDKFVVVSDEELEALAPRRSRDIELQRFVPRAEIDPVYFVRAYYLVPAGAQAKPYRLLAETMERAGRAGIASFVMRDRAYAVAIFADSGILRAATLRFGDELRTPETVGLPKARKVDAVRARKMEKAIGELAQPKLDESELRDEEPERLLALARAKHERGEDVVEAPAAERDPEGESGGELIDLMALLKQRLAGRGGAAPKERKAPPDRRRRPAAAPRA